MSYLLGEVVEFSWAVQIDDADVEPSSFAVIITKPNGEQETVDPVDNPEAGEFAATYAPTAAGHYSWVARAAGSVVAVADGAFDVFDPNPQIAPLTGLAAPWSDAAALLRRPEVVAYNAERAASQLAAIEPYVLNDALRFASGILYALSGRQFTGIGRTYCRPVARSNGWDARSWGQATPGYWQGWASPDGWVGLARGSGSSYPSEIALNYPVQRIVEVKVDGQVIPGPDTDAPEYRVDDYRLLVRTRASGSSRPTARAGWPTCQRLDLPDTEEGTFSVTYVYGAPPPPEGVIAAEIFATEIALDMVGAESRLPARIRELSRQGETIALLDSLDALQKGWIGIPICDYFIASANPMRLARRGSVWTPDMGRVRTPTTGR